MLKKNIIVTQKKWVKSKTIVINLITAILILVDRFQGTDFIKPETAVYIIAGLNVVLRVLTKGPVEW